MTEAQRFSRCWRSTLLAALVLLVAPAVGLAGNTADSAPLPKAAPEQVGMDAERLGRVNELLRGYVDDDQLAGAVVFVARRGHVVLHEAFGKSDLESGRAMRTDDLFRIASQTKALVSAAILMLQEEGKLLISDPLSKYMPEFDRTTVAVAAEDSVEAGDFGVVPAKRRVTLRDLLTHTSGYGYGYGPGAERWKEAGIQGWYFADRDEPVAETISRMAALPADAQPGEAYVYGYSTDILGAVVEKASGKSLDEFLRERLFGPLGMTDTQFFPQPGERQRLATVYSAGDAGLSKAPEPGHMVGQGHYVDGPRQSFSGGAGLVSTAADYGRFMQAMLNGGVLEGQRVLAPASVRLMTSNHVGDLFGRPGIGFGLGFAVTLDVGARGEPSSVGEFGWGGAYHSTYWADPLEELVVVYLTQLIPAGSIDDHAKLRALIYSAIVDSNQ